MHTLHNNNNNCIRAQVVNTDNDCVQIVVNDQQYQAEWAMAVPVVLSAGDQVLCMYDDTDYYVLAPIGRQQHCHIQAETIDIEAQNLTLKADKLELAARRLFEKTVDAYRWTSNLLQWCCGRQRILIDGQQQVRAGRIDINAKASVRIDGEHIHLG